MKYNYVDFRFLDFIDMGFYMKLFGVHIDSSLETDGVSYLFYSCYGRSAHLYMGEVRKWIVFSEEFLKNLNYWN